MGFLFFYLLLFDNVKRGVYYLVAGSDGGLAHRHQTHTDIFDKDSGTEIPHISLAGKADALIIAPATANVIAKLSHGIADDMLSTTLLAGSVTAFCGPIGFIGLAMPHVARITFRSADHRILMPAAMLWGAFSLLVCTYVCDVVARSGVILPVNTITSLLGIPVIIYVVLRNSNR